MSISFVVYHLLLQSINQGETNAVQCHFSPYQVPFVSVSIVCDMLLEKCLIFSWH